MGKYMGVDVGGTNIKFGIFSEEGELLRKWQILTSCHEGETKIWKNIRDEIFHSTILDELKGIGIGIPGPVLENGFVEVCVNLGLHNFNPVTILKEYFPNIKIAAVNDANAAALGEQWKGSGQGYQSICMVTLGTGVGGAVILDGKLRYGANGMSGELSHIPLNPEETDLCTCGAKGCIDQIASATGIVRHAKKVLETGTDDSVLRKQRCLSAKMIIDAAKQGDQVADQIVRHCMKYLAKALAAVTYIVDPEAFIVGGGVSNAGEYLINMIQEYYDSCITLSKKTALVVKASLGNDAGIYGAAKIVMN